MLRINLLSSNIVQWLSQLFFFLHSAYIKSTSLQRVIHMNCVVLEPNLKEKGIITCMEELLPVEFQTAANYMGQGHCI